MTINAVCYPFTHAKLDCWNTILVRDFDRKRNVVRIVELAKSHFYKTFPTPTENLMNESIQKGFYANLHKYISHAIRKGYLFVYFQFKPISIGAQ